MIELFAEMLDERSAIMVIDGGLSEADAQVQARASVVAYFEAMGWEVETEQQEDDCGPKALR